MVQGQRYHSPQKITLLSSNQWGTCSSASGPDIQEITEKVQVTTKRTSSVIPDAIQKDPTAIWILTQGATEREIDSHKSGCDGAVSGSRATGYSS